MGREHRHDPPTLGELLARTARAIHLQARERLAPIGLTPAAARALGTLARNGEPMRMSDLAARLHVVPRSATTVVDALEEAGLIERRPDPEDRRSTLVHLTARGRERVHELRAARIEAGDELLSPLTEAERAQLRTLLEKLDTRPPRC